MPKLNMDVIQKEVPSTTDIYVGEEFEDLFGVILSPFLYANRPGNEIIFGYNQLGPGSIQFDWCGVSPAADMLSECMPQAGRFIDGRAEVRDMSGYTTHKHFGRPLTGDTYWGLGADAYKIITASQHLTRCMRDHLKPIFCPSPVLPRPYIRDNYNENCDLATQAPEYWKSVNYARYQYEYSCWGWYMIMGMELNYDSPPVYEFRDICPTKAPPAYSDGIFENDLRDLVRDRVETILAVAKALPGFAGNKTGAVTLVDTWVVNNEMGKGGNQTSVGKYNFVVLDEVYQTFLADPDYAETGVLPKFQIYESDTNALGDMGFYQGCTYWLQYFADEAYGEDLCPWEIDCIKTHWYEYTYNSADLAAREVTTRQLLSPYGKTGHETVGDPLAVPPVEVPKDNMQYWSWLSQYVWAWRTDYTITQNATIGIGEYAICTQSTARNSTAVPWRAGMSAKQGTRASYPVSTIVYRCLQTHLTSYTLTPPDAPTYWVLDADPISPTGKAAQSWAGAWHTASVSLRSVNSGCRHWHFMGHTGNPCDHVRVTMYGTALTTTGVVLRFLAEYFGPTVLWSIGYSEGIDLFAATDEDNEFVWLLYINRSESKRAKVRCHVSGVGVSFTWDTVTGGFRHTLALPTDTPWSDYNPDTAVVTDFVAYPLTDPTAHYVLNNEIIPNRAMEIFQLKITAI
uniref:Uncharacterized protein n=1 Tax=viral metagenome TaxID=1070528 RepID=A0A6M3J2H7_9ZZZZ